MYIRRIMVRNFRKLTAPHEIENIGDGITVIAGNNEEGKSTLLNAIRSVVFERHNITGKPLEAMFPYGSKVRVEVQLDFELNKELYRLEKIFGPKSGAILKKSDGSTLEGHAAEEELSQLLAFRVPKRGESKHDERGLLGFFWLEQGHNLDKLNLAETGREKLHTLLEKEIGEVVGGSLGQKIIQKAQEERGKLLTDGGKPKKHSRLYDALQEVDKTKDTYGQAKEKDAEYQQNIENLEKIRQEIPQVHDALKEALHEASEAKKEQGKVEALRIDSKNAEHEIKQAEGNLTIARNSWKQRQKLINEVKKCKNDVEQINEKLTQKKSTQKDLDSQLKQAEAKLKLATQNRKKADQQQKLAKICKLKQEVTDDDKKLADVSALKQQLQTAKERLDKAKVTQQCFENLKNINDEVDKLKNQISASATHVQFLPTKDQAVIGSKGNITPKQRVEVSEKERFTLGGFGAVEIEPAVAGLADRQQLLAKKESELQTELVKVGVGDMKEAEAHFNIYRQQVEKIKEIKIRQESLPDIDSLHDDRKRKKSELEKLRNEVGKIENTEVIDLDLAEQHLKSAAQEEDKAREICEIARRKKYAQEKDISKYQGGLQEIASTLNEKEKELKDTQSENSDEKLVAEMKHCENQTNEKRKIKKEIDNKITIASPEKIQMQLKNAEVTENNLKKRESELKEQETRVSERLSIAGAEGTGEGLDKACGAYERAKTDLDRVQLEADAWKLLVDTLTEAEREDKAKFVEPILKCVEPFLSILFPQSKPVLDEKTMEIKELHRGEQKEPFHSLSIGTREQLSILVRLAFAKYLKENGYPSMVILDDALVYADDGRFEHMQHALSEAGKNVQIVILTCRARDWQQSGFPVLNLADALRTNA